MVPLRCRVDATSNALVFDPNTMTAAAAATVHDQVADPVDVLNEGDDLSTDE